jgi:sugar lactone lactonase YvrE
MRAPEGIALAPGGTVFVADTGNHRIQVFDARAYRVPRTNRKGTPGAARNTRQACNACR